MPPKPIPGVLAISPYKGGEATIPGFAEPVKLSSNENPFGPGEAARAAYRNAVDQIHIYPEGGAVALRRAIAERYGLDADRIVCGAGSDEIFYLLARAYLSPGDEIVQSQHGFSIYGIAAKIAGAEVRVATDVDYGAHVDSLLACVGPRTKIVFVANPNNPTGTYLPHAEIQRLHAGLPENVILVIDAAYAEYVRRNDYSSGLELAGAHDNVIVTRTFSKVHGLAALRVGWGFGPPAIVDALNRVRGPFNVSIPAQMAAIAAIGDVGHVDRSVTHNERELARVEAALAAMGLKVTPSVGNFALMHFKDPATADAADLALRARGYILRKLGSYQLPAALRLTIGAVEQNDGVLAALADFQARR